MVTDGGGMSTVIEILDGWSADGDPTLESLGGKSAIVSDLTLARSAHGPFLAKLVLNDWSRADADLASKFVGVTLQTCDESDVDDLADWIVTSPDALPDLVPTLVPLLRIIVANHDYRGEVLLEAWTRLALGGWCKTLEVKSALTALAGAAQEQTHVSIHLTRALGAAIEQWEEPELIEALRLLTQIEDVEDDAAFELGMARLRDALTSTNASVATDALHDAARWLEESFSVEQRPDAGAFRRAVRLLLSFSQGSPISEAEIEDLRTAAADYLLGYRGEERHWRQPRADTLAEWMRLAATLNAATMIDDVWWHPDEVIAAAGRVLAAHCTLHLVTTVDSQGASSGQPGVFSLLQPRIIQAATRRGDAAALLDRWLSEASNQLPAEIDAIADLRNALLDSGRAGDVFPKAEMASGVTVASLLIELEPRLAAHPMLEQFLKDRAGIAPVAGLTIQQNAVMDQILTQLEPMDGYRTAARFVEPVLASLVRFSTWAIDHSGGGERARAWHVSCESSRPKEHDLADELQVWLSASGLVAEVEIPNTAGGRADVVIYQNNERLVIEAKKVDASRSNDELTSSHGPQASEYTKSGIRFVFLAVLDLVFRQSRLDLASTLWVSSVRDAPGDLGQVGDVGVIGLRVLGNAGNPSAIRPESTRRRRDRNTATPQS